jgi:hypothetical protein
MNFTGTVRANRHSAAKKMSEIVIETAESRPQFLTLTYFVREGKTMPEVQVNDIIFAAAELRGRQWIDPDTGEVNYFMSLMCVEIIIVKKGGANETK